MTCDAFICGFNVTIDHFSKSFTCFDDSRLKTKTKITKQSLCLCVKHTTSIYTCLRITLKSPLIMTLQHRVNVRVSASVWIIMFSWFNLLPNMNAILIFLEICTFINLEQKLSKYLIQQVIDILSPASYWITTISMFLIACSLYWSHFKPALSTVKMPACLQYIPCNHVIFAASPYNFTTLQLLQCHQF